MVDYEKETLPDFDEALRRIAHTPKGVTKEKKTRKEIVPPEKDGTTKPKTTNTS